MKPPFCPVSEYTTWSESSASSKATSNKWRHLEQSRTCSAAATCAFSAIALHSFISAACASDFIFRIPVERYTCGQHKRMLSLADSHCPLHSENQPHTPCGVFSRRSTCPS